MSSEEHYRRTAQDMRALAKTSTRSELVKIFLKLAEQYDALADHEIKVSRAPDPSDSQPPETKKTQSTI